jgi:hypothetical protein
MKNLTSKHIKMIKKWIMLQTNFNRTQINYHLSQTTTNLANQIIIYLIKI